MHYLSYQNDYYIRCYNITYSLLLYITLDTIICENY